MGRILAINGSYRDDGVTDQVVGIMVTALSQAGAETEAINLRDYPIEFCLNCRECTQQPGVAPGICVLQDGMQALIDKIEQADAYILASPTNLGSVTATFKRFIERLVPYAYWPWGKDTPRFRKAGMANKKAILVSSCAVPGIIGRWFYTTHKQLRMTANVIGARPVGTIFTGLVSQQVHPKLSPQVTKKASALAAKLV